MSILRYELKHSLKPLLFWSIGIGLMIVAGMTKYEGFAQSPQAMQALLDSIPKALFAVLGMGQVDLTTLAGFYSAIASYLSVMIAIFALSKGVTIVAKEESEKTADFLYVKPKPRWYILTMKLAVVTFNILWFALVVVLCSYLILPTLSDEPIHHLIWNFSAHIFTIGMFWGYVGFTLATLVKHARKAYPLGVALVLFSYLLGVFYELSDRFSFVRYLSIFKLYDAKDLVLNPFNMLPMLLTLVICVGLVVFGMVRYSEKDLLL
ncbi:MAG: ABC transporter permease subunit [Erysipelotrichaceae bacterium]